MYDYLFPYTHTIGYLVLNPYVRSRALFVYVRLNTKDYTYVRTNYGTVTNRIKDRRLID